jgi:hypothetical protein
MGDPLPGGRLKTCGFLGVQTKENVFGSSEGELLSRRPPPPLRKLSDPSLQGRGVWSGASTGILCLNRRRTTSGARHTRTSRNPFTPTPAGGVGERSEPGAGVSGQQYPILAKIPTPANPIHHKPKEE